jgi:hypothetical protein
MLVVRNIRVSTLKQNALTVSWEIESTTLSLVDYTLTVLRSDSEAGEFSAVGSPFLASSTDEYEDTTVNLYSKIREHRYRIRVTRSADGEYLDYGTADPNLVMQGEDPGSVSLRSPPDIQALEAIRRFDIMLQEYAGRKLLLFTQKTWGTRCTTCWDKLKRRRTRSSCPDCYDTGIDGGYWEHKETWAMKAPADVTTAIGKVMELQPRDVVMVFSASPRIKPRDMIVDAEGIRYRVLQLPVVGEKLRALTHQRVVIRELSRDQVEYTIDIDWDIDPFTATPSRQHIAAVDIDSYYNRARELGVEDT